jgi:hypothetical protein
VTFIGDRWTRGIDPTSTYGTATTPGRRAAIQEGRQEVTLDEARQHIGKGVVYQACSHCPREDGVITSVNDVYAFVRYAGDQHSKATDPAMLAF